MAPIRPVNFSELFDKLRDRKVGKEVHTARGYDPRKDLYYKSLIGKDVPWQIHNKMFFGRVRHTKVEYVWSDEVSESFISEDTYAFWGRDDWLRLMNKFYGQDRVFLIVVYGLWTEIVTNQPVRKEQMKLEV